MPNDECRMSKPEIRNPSGRSGAAGELAGEAAAGLPGNFSGGRAALLRNRCYFGAPTFLSASPWKLNYSVGTTELNRRDAKNAEKTAPRPAPASSLLGDRLGSLRRDVFLCAFRASAVCLQVLPSWRRLRLEPRRQEPRRSNLAVASNERCPTGAEVARKSFPFTRQLADLPFQPRLLGFGF
jgi:hypothetical protein